MTPLAAPADSTIVTFDELFVLIADGDRRAFADLYERTAHRILGLVTQCLRDPAQSEEVTQEVYLEFWQNASRFDGSKGNALSWMLTIARRRAIDRVRSAQSAHDRDLKVGIRELPTSFDVVSETIESRQISEDLRRAMTRISARQREAIEMAYLGSMTHTEIALALGATTSTVKSRLHEGLVALRRVMASELVAAGAVRRTA